MALTPTQRHILTKANQEGATRADKHPAHHTELLIAAGLLTEHDHNNDGTWTLKTTKAGRALLNAPIEHTPLYLARPGRNQGDYTTVRHRAIDDLEVVPPAQGYVEKARITAAEARASFRRDLEEERARRNNIKNTANLSNRALRHINAARDRAA